VIVDDPSADWTAHRLAGDTHKTLLYVWDQQFETQPELRCETCGAWRPLSKQEADEVLWQNAEARGNVTLRWDRAKELGWHSPEATL
jgi:hypothetical protein